MISTASVSSIDLAVEEAPGLRRADDGKDV